MSTTKQTIGFVLGFGGATQKLHFVIYGYKEIIVILSLACIDPTVKPYSIAGATELLL